jgi:HAD superfamily 5'-nucleotidase-like hydrolase
LGTRDSAQELLPIADLALPIEAQPPKSRRIYCNRDLRLDQIEAVGFDMDYTLAIYHQDAIDQLSVEATAQKLVARGYPTSLFDMTYATRFPIRGLLVDVKLGNIIKTDRYRYAKTAYHGTRELSSEERKKLYQGKRVRPGMPRFYAVDTLYALSEVTVFAAVIDTLGATKHRGSLDFPKVFQDVRDSIDEAHRDGTIKNIIASELPRFIERHPDLPATLHKLRSAGKKLFLLTNSEPPYTDKVMRYLLEGWPLDQAPYKTWRGFFDVVVSEARKPRFFTEREPFEEVVDLAAPSGHLGAPVKPKPVHELVRGKMYRGGCHVDLERMLGVPSDHILYVGDHIFGDVLRAKKDSSWRTLMIIQEMTDELDAIERYAPEIERVHKLEARYNALVDGVRERQSLLKVLHKRLEEPELDPEERVEMEAARTRLKHAIDRVRGQVKAVEEDHRALERQLDRAAHPYWGSPFKAESELSSFGEQVERYACLYTDRVTNLIGYSGSHFFRTPRHRMAHEQ